MNELELKEKVVNPVTTQANNLQVTSPEEYTSAVDYLKEIKSVQKKVSEYFSDIKKKTHEAWKSICQKENNLLTPLQQAEVTIKKKVLLFQREEEKKRREEQARLQAEADEKARKEKERLEKRADTLKTPELKEQAQQMAENTIAPNIHVESELPKEKGISTSTTWKAKVTDKRKFVEASINDANILAMIDIDLQALNRIAKATKGQMQYPGIEFYQEQNINIRTN